MLRLAQGEGGVRVYATENREEERERKGKNRRLSYMLVIKTEAKHARHILMLEKKEVLNLVLEPGKERERIKGRKG